MQIYQVSLIYTQMIPMTFLNSMCWSPQASDQDRHKPLHTLQRIVGHADTEMTEHYLHVQESIRQSAVQLFSEAFSA